MDPSVGPSTPSSNQRTEEQQQEDMARARQAINWNSRRQWPSFFPYGRSARLAALISVLPAYLISRLFKDSKEGTGFITVLGAYVVISITLSILFTLWVRKKPADSKWHIFLGL